MKLRRLAIERLPGIDQPFGLEELGNGFHVIVGPNGIGKSSLCRAARALLWSDHGPEGYMAASALFDREGEHWRVERDGSRHRWQRDGMDAEAPPLPEPHLDGCFFLVLRDLLDASRDAGSDLAGVIRRQMSGGFDLEEAEASLFGVVGPRCGQRERSELEQAKRQVRLERSSQEEIARRDDRVEALERDAATAREAQRRLAHFESALELHARRAELARVEADLAALPEALERLTGEEMGQLEQRERELEEKRSQRRKKESELLAAREAGASTRLEEPLDAAVLATLSARCTKLAELENQLEIAQEAWQKQRRATAEAGRAVGGRGDSVSEIDLTGDGDLFAFLRDATRAETDRAAIDQRLRLLEGRVLPEESGQRLELLRRGVESLRDWLLEPDPEGGSSRAAKQRWFVAIAAAALVAFGAGLGLWIHPAVALLLAAGLTLASVLWLLRPAPRARYARDAAERAFPADLEPPSSWTRDGVTERLREVESELTELEARQQRARDRGVERADLENRWKALDERRSEFERRRRELASRLGLEEIPPDAELVDMARALDQLRQARQAEASAGERVRDIAERHRTLLSELSAAITEHGEMEPADAASARAGIDQLRVRDNQLRSARDAEVRLQDSLQQLDGELARIAEIISEVYRKAGLELGDRAALARLLEDLGRHRELRHHRDVLVSSISSGEEKLASAGELQLVECDREKLESDKGSLEERTAGLDRLHRQIAEIRTDVKRARARHDLEDAIAKRDVALTKLEERRQEAMWAAAGRFLLEAVKREHETHQMPRVLERARELLGTFTHHAYELRVAPDDAGSFVAIEARSRAGRRPHELSDGTRAQLLLAARLAFAQEAEQGVRLPLFLDEALDQSDPVRFRAIARSLGRMVEDEGRQIFYLTNDPTDARRIQEALEEEGCHAARIIDLAAVRNRAASVSGPEALRVPALPQVPSPSGATPEGYGAALQVPPLDPRREPVAQHLLYLLWDDLPLLHRLLQSGIERVGQWLNLSRSEAPLAREIKDEKGTGSQLDARAEVLEAFCRAWREGRGRLVDREAVEQSGAVSTRYLEDVVEITRELGGDGERLIQVLRAREDERLQGFRTKAADGLEAFLIDEGHIDPRPTLDESEITTRALATPAANRLPGRVVAECVHRWWRLCRGGGTGPA